jgi:hypothetical protein
MGCSQGKARAAGLKRWLPLVLGERFSGFGMDNIGFSCAVDDYDGMGIYGCISEMVGQDPSALSAWQALYALVGFRYCALSHINSINHALRAMIS